MTVLSVYIWTQPPPLLKPVKMWLKRLVLQTRMDFLCTSVSTRRWALLPCLLSRHINVDLPDIYLHINVYTLWFSHILWTRFLNVVQPELNYSTLLVFCLQMWSLGSCGKHVLDAVSQCEQEMRRQGKQEKDAPWRLSIQKELFTPWHKCSVDPISTDLIYRQVIKSIKSGEYTSEKVRLRGEKTLFLMWS